MLAVHGGRGRLSSYQLLSSSSARLANINVGGALKAGTSLLQSQKNANNGESADIGLIGLAVM
jgi:hypothetical protein